MSNISASMDMSQVDPKELQRFLDMALKNIAEVVNGDLDFQTNFNCKLKSVLFSAATTDVLVAHGLNRVVSGYIITSLSANMVVYGTGGDNLLITLQSSAPGTAGILFF